MRNRLRRALARKRATTRFSFSTVLYYVTFRGEILFILSLNHFYSITCECACVHASECFWLEKIPKSYQYIWYHFTLLYISVILRYILQDSIHNTVEKIRSKFLAGESWSSREILCYRNIILCVRPVCHKCLADIYFFTRYTRYMHVGADLSAKKKTTSGKRIPRSQRCTHCKKI
jgi:hypothetical protein